MNSAPQVQTAEISDAELDTVSGGLSPEANISLGATSVNSTELLSQANGVTGEALSVLGQYRQVGVNVSF